MTSCIDPHFQNNFHQLVVSYWRIFRISTIHRKSVYSILTLTTTFNNYFFVSLSNLGLSTHSGDHCRKMILNRHHNVFWHVLTDVVTFDGGLHIICDLLVTLFTHFVPLFFNLSSLRRWSIPTNTSHLSLSNCKHSLIVSHEEPLSMSTLGHSFFLFWSKCILPPDVLDFSLFWLCDGLRYRRTGDTRLGRRIHCRRLHLLHCHLLLVSYVVCPPRHKKPLDFYCFSSQKVYLRLFPFLLFLLTLSISAPFLCSAVLLQKV